MSELGKPDKAIANAVFRSAINEQDFLREFLRGTVFVKSTYDKQTGAVQSEIIPASDIYKD